MAEPWCQVLAADGYPLRPIRSKHAVWAVMCEKASVVEYHDSAVVRTVREAFRAPKTIIKRKHVNVPDRVKFNLHNLKRRDNKQCQYCSRDHLGQNEFFTKDHVIPTSRGGKNEWANVVLCCNTCNNKKGDRTPEEAGMRLVRQPITPTRWDVR